jgi:GH25 family lysozyme M1 (1,4-beta-N-acetylmuramidase)
VHRGDLIAYSSDAGVPGSPHLHFEVQLSGVPVDPYGWQGTGTDPYTRALNVNLWNVPTGNAPSITSVLPNPVTGVPLPGRVTLTLTGANFVSGLSVFVTWTGGSKTLNATNVNVVSSTQVQILLATDVAADNWTVQVTNPNSQQSNIAAFQVVAPTSGSLPLGIDVSTYQGTVDWNQVANPGGKAFAFIRATAGINTTDSQFAQNVVGAKNAGLLVEAWHFAYPQYFTAHAEAQKFLSVAGPYIGAGYLPPALDIEDSPSENSYPYLMGNAALSQWIRDWCSEVQQASGVKPMVYAIRYYAQNYFEANINQYPYWVVTDSGIPDSAPSNMGVWSTWEFQQYRYGGSGGTCPGVTGPVDLDSFNGDLTALNALTNRIIVPVNPPSFGGSSVSAGKLQTTLSGLSSGATVVMQVSSDLKNWTPMKTNVVNGSTLSFTNTINPAMHDQFFRAMVQ